MDKTASQFVRRLLSAEVAGHPLVWSATTGLFILIGYVWLQQFAKPYASKLSTEDKSVGQVQSSQWNPAIYREVETLEEMGITQSRDDPRADEYRRIIEEEAKISPLLTQASRHMGNEIYASTDKKDAWHLYQSVLEIDPQNTSAKLATKEILSILQGNAEEAIETRQYEDAEKWLSQLDEIQPFSTFQHEQRNQISDQIKADRAEKERQQQERDRLTRLKTALDQAYAVFKATPPEPRAAYDLYQVALEIDENNPTALSGIRQIKRFYAKQTHQLITDNRFDKAKQILARLTEIKGDDTDIKTLRLMLANGIARAETAEKARLAAISAEQPQTKQPSQANKDTPPGPTPKTAPQPTAQATQEKKPDQVAVEEIDVNQQADITINPISSTTENRAKQLNNGIQAYYAGNYNDAFEWLHPLAEDGVARAQFRIGIMYFQGRTVVKNQDVAAQWISKALPTILRAAQDDIAWAQSDLGTAYELGIALNKDMTRAANWYTKAANNGYAGAQTNLGVLYGMGDGVEYDRQLAVYWLKKAAEQGDKIAEDNLEILNAR